MNKKLIRNPEQKPKNISVETKITEYSDIESDQEQHDLVKVDEVVILDVPKKNFSKVVEKRCEKVRNLEVRKLKTCTDLTRDERATVNEKITKNVLNFPFDKKLYKELISLQLSDKPVPVLQTIPVNYEPTIRDKVPKLEDFYVPLEKTEFNIPVTCSLGSHTTIRNYDGLRMHKLMSIWKDDS